MLSIFSGGDKDERQREEDRFSDNNCFISFVVCLSVQLYVTNLLYIRLLFEETMVITDFSRPVKSKSCAEEKGKRILGCSRKQIYFLGLVLTRVMQKHHC